MAAQPLTYVELLNKFNVEQNKTYENNTRVTFTGNQNEKSITRYSADALNIPDRYFKVMGSDEYMRKEYIKIEIFEKGTNNRVDGRFGLTHRMNNFDIHPYQAPGGGNKRRRTKKSKKSKRRRSFK